MHRNGLYRTLKIYCRGWPLPQICHEQPGRIFPSLNCCLHDDCTLCSPSVQGELPRCVLILSAGYAEVWKCEVKILATERITGVKNFILSLEEHSPTKSVYQLFTKTHLFKMCLSWHGLSFVQTWLLQGELGSHAQNIQQPCGMRFCPKIQEILVKALTWHQIRQFESQCLVSKKECRQLK